MKGVGEGEVGTVLEQVIKKCLLFGLIVDNSLEDVLE